MTQEAPILRPSARAILLDPENRVLLFRVEDPRAMDRSFWITPGGGIEPGESELECLEREILEETGLSGCELGPLVWVRERIFPWNGRWIRQMERYYLARTAVTDVHAGLQLEYEMHFLKEARWWDVEEMAQATSERFVPREFVQHLRPLLAGELPSEPVTVGR